MHQNLSKEQQEIAFFNNCEGALQVEASAGSGKTRILTERVRHLLTKKEDKFFSVLCLTFTNKAAEEMKERLQDVPKLKERAFIGTFHEFCLNQIIRNQRQEIGLKEVPHLFEKDEDRKNIIVEIISQREDLKAKYEFPNILDPNKKAKKQRELLDKCINFISEGKRNLITVPDEMSIWENWKESNTYLYKNYKYTLENQNAMDYDDILFYAYRILTERDVIANLYRRRYSYILVDEAQDLNFAQYNILKSICGETHKNVIMVGDPKQAIYAFNGASSDFMQKEFVVDFGAETRKIKQNYRSSTKVLELAHFIRPNGGMPNNYFEGIREITPFENEKKEAAWIISKIKEWINVGIYPEKEMNISISLENIAVLARNRYIFKNLIDLLEQDDTLKENYHLRKGSERFAPESQLIKALDLGFRIIVNPFDILHFNQLYKELGLSQKTSQDRLEQLLSLEQQVGLTKEQFFIISILVPSWKKINKNHRLIDRVLAEIKNDLNTYDLADEEKLKIAFDIMEFQKLWSSFLRNTSFESQNLANFRYFIALNSADENKEGLALATIHTVKGLEFDIIFLMGMNEDVLPYYKAKNKKALEEERNNAYVAVTRAKKCIYISYPQNRLMPWGDSKPQAISSFIQHFSK